LIVLSAVARSCPRPCFFLCNLSGKQSC
jgi:hypothetical protein